MSSLTYLGLSGAALTGTIPTDIGLLSSLTYLGLVGGALTGTIPTDIGQMSSLEMLSLSNSSLTGFVPTEMGQLSHLSELHLSNTTLTGPVPQEVGELCNLSLVALLLDGTDLTRADSKVNFCSWWPGKFPPANSTHELIINVQYDQYPEETSWLFQESLTGDCILPSCNGTAEGEWSCVTGSDAHVQLEANGKSSVSATVVSETFCRFTLLDSYGDGLERYAWATITTAEGSVLWSLDESNSFENKAVAYLWVDGDGHIELVKNATSKQIVTNLFY